MRRLTQLLLWVGLSLPAHAIADVAAPLDGARMAFVLEDVARIPAVRVTRSARLSTLVSAPDGSHRLFVVDLDGAIMIIENGKVSPKPFLDIAKLRRARFLGKQGEEGLISVAFHPDFAHPGRPGFGKLYTFSTEAADASTPALPTRVGVPSHHHDVVIEWSVGLDDASVVDPGSAREVLRIVHPTDGHMAGQVAFNPTATQGDADYGMLYVSVGDGANTVDDRGIVDDWRLAQDKRVPLGKILRIDPLQRADKRYAIPPDNPFVGNPEALPEIWAYGLRNPQRFSWDTEGEHRMLIADIGQKQVEEINIGRRGANYGWGEREGIWMVTRADENVRGALAVDDTAAGFTPPALMYGHKVGIAITGGYVYRGKAIPALRGYYVFGDIASGRIFAADVAALVDGKPPPFFELPLEHRGQRQSLLQIVKGDRADLRFGLDDAGELYVLSKRDGTVRRLARSVATETPIHPVEPPIER